MNLLGVRVQAQKELLDAELDFHKRMSSGEDTTDLKRKLGQLQVEVRKQAVKDARESAASFIGLAS